uniref:Uncharacterized protein n=1 Tax=viral metagenome TaxID=1070528 RepID=A0A6C0I8G5_9ZZZZ
MNEDIPTETNMLTSYLWIVIPRRRIVRFIMWMPTQHTNLKHPRKCMNI